jgi:hypothetical protein
MMPSFPTETLSRGSLHAVVRRWRVAFKLWLSKHMCIASFCKDCGRDVTDFVVPDDVWVKIEPTIKRGRVLCYDCFCEHCRQIGLPTVWKLEITTEEKNQSGAALAPAQVRSGDLLATFGTEYPILADLKGGWYLVAHPNGPAIAHSGFDILSSLAHEHEDVPEGIRSKATWALMKWAAKQPTWPRVANKHITDK